MAKIGVLLYRFGLLIYINVVSLKVGDSAAGIVVAAALGVFLDKATIVAQRGQYVAAGAVCLVELAVKP